MADPKEPPKKHAEESASTKPAVPKRPEDGALRNADVQRRRPYEPPRIVSKDKLEGRANVCDPFAGKTAPPGCGVNRS